jgi:peptide/nickel transport system substrate-binding protein
VAPAHAAGKTLTYALYAEPDTLDSAKMATDVALHPAWLLCDTLVNLSRDGQRVEPALAESWTLAPDGLLATIKLRAGVRFHDGTALDADAVKASFERHFRPEHPLYTAEPKNTRAQILTELIDEIRVRDPGTVVFKLKYPGLHYLSQVDVVSPAAAARLGASFGRQPVCSGPFVFKSWTPRRIEVTANEQYWGGRPRLDRVVFRVLHEPAALVEAMVKGEVDFSPHVVDPIHFERIRGSARLALVRIPALNMTHLGFNLSRPPFDDVRVRRAIAHGLDRARMTVFLGRGAAIPAKGPLAPAIKGHDPAASQVAYDPEAGRRLLAEAGFGSGLSVSLAHHEGILIHAELAGAIRNDLRRLGVTVELAGKASWSALLAATRAPDAGMFLYAWNVRGPYPERVLIPLFHSRSLGATNLTRYSNPALDTLLEGALRLPEAQALDAFARAQRIIVDDAPMVFLYHATRVAAVAERVRRLEVNLGALPYDKLVNVELTP